MFDPINGALIGDPGRQALVMLDLAVEFDALVTHRNPAQIVKRSNPYWSPDLKTIESKDCSVNLWPARSECSEDFAWIRQPVPGCEGRLSKDLTQLGADPIRKLAMIF
jgi:hypothetical protein